MRDQQRQQSRNTDRDTERMAQSTMNQGQQTIEQLIDLQRNMARMTLSALEWQETAQRQGLEMTKTILESAPGSQFTESMVQSYLQGMEAVVPEMERAMEKGMQAATQPQMEEMGSQPIGQGRASEAEPRRHETGGRMADQQMRSQQAGGQQLAGEQTSTERPSDVPRPQPGEGRASSERSQPQRSAGIGEWVSPREYGGESASAAGFQQRPMTGVQTRSGQSDTTPQERRSQQDRLGGSQRSRSGGPPQESDRTHTTGQFEQHGQYVQEGRPQRHSQEPQPRSGQRGPQSQQGGQPRGSEQGGRASEYGQPMQGRESSQPPQRGASSQPRTTGQGRVTDQYSQRIETEHREQGGRPTARSHQEERARSEARDSREAGEELPEGRSGGEMDRADETGESEDTHGLSELDHSDENEEQEED
ncbi:hypothetical protein [Natrinema longum]|uniref:Phasin protein n=1 Tax=Natrinema longum TaxID=370324 RepID=A0A8A2U8D6_9EURY|nr:hypothetical protein [Natrinema longum]MBZ6493796.1 hypothetical protein [Natrinema longum]QSW84866.1 hypothetical protein J0X27_15660 [Natrinema longum]